MNRTSRTIPEDLLIILIWIMAAFSFVIIPVIENTFMRTILTIPMVLFIPGYMLIAVLFPKKNDLEMVERIALSFGLSIVVVPLLGLLLNFTFGIRMISILLTLYIYSMILMFVTIYRRKKLSDDEQFSISFSSIYENIYENINNKVRGPKDRADLILTIILIFMVVLTIGTVYYATTTPKIGERFTEFYILNSSGKTDNYPVDLKLNSPTTLLIGISNHEYSRINYTVQISLDKSILTSEELILNHNDTQEKSVIFVPNKEGTNMKLEFLLFKDHNFTDPYRSLYLWTNTT